MLCTLKTLTDLVIYLYVFLNWDVLKGKKECATITSAL